MTGRGQRVICIITIACGEVRPMSRRTVCRFLKNLQRPTVGGYAERALAADERGKTQME